jgi:hypothetical protein
VVVGVPASSSALRARFSGHPIAVALRACWGAAPRLTILVLGIAVARGIVPNLLYYGTAALAAQLAVARDDATIAGAIAGITLAYFFIRWATRSCRRSCARLAGGSTATSSDR